MSYREALLAKLIEEAQEASNATADDLPEKPADVLDVLRALTVTAGMSWPQLLALAEDNRSRRGGFGRRVFLGSSSNQRNEAAARLDRLQAHWDLPSCRIEGVVVAHIYPCIGILTHDLPSCGSPPWSIFHYSGRKSDRRLRAAYRAWVAARTGAQITQFGRS